MTGEVAPGNLKTHERAPILTLDCPVDLMPNVPAGSLHDQRKENLDPRAGSPSDLPTESE